MNTRFTIDGSDALEKSLGELCGRVAEGVLRIVPAGKLHAILLAGGYGRGEGGVLATPSGDEPYNDLEFYILLRGSELLSRRRYGGQIRELSEELSQLSGIEIELKLLSVAKLQRSPVTMFYYDLVMGYRPVYGDDAWLAGCEHHRAAHRIPLHEATRLLMNRCAGLLYAQERLSRSRFTDEDADFVGRNLAKAKLAFGDVILTSRSQYHWSCRERQKRLKKLAAETGGENLSSLLLLHEQGVQFKLHPLRNGRSQEELRAELSFLKDIGRELWLQLESCRLGTRFQSVVHYSMHSASKCPESTVFKNRLVNARTFGLMALGDTTYPRERLLRTLPILLWEAQNASFLIFAQRQLKTGARETQGLVTAYENLWRMYN